MKKLFAVTLAPLLLALALVAHAADVFPNKPVRLVVAFPIAGATDILARHFALKMSEQLGYQVIVDNRPGAGGTMGSRIVSGALPDGYTLTMGTTSTHAIGPHLYTQKPYDPVADFTHVTQMATSPTVMMVAAQVPANSLKEFIALAKAQPGKFNFGSSGIGTQFHLSVDVKAFTDSACMRLRRSAGIFGGANRPHHKSASNAVMPASAMVDTSGSTGVRFLPETPSGRTRPCLINVNAAGGTSNSI